MTIVGVFLGGEGRNDLGSRSGHPVYQSDERPGVVQTLLRRVQAEGWVVVGAINWSEIRKLRARGASPDDGHNVRALVLHAREANADVVAFVRDADGDRERTTVILSAIAAAKEQFPSPDLIGGTAIPVLEGWMLAMKGVPETENLSKAAAQRRLEEDYGVRRKDTLEMTTVATQFDLQRLPADATSLRSWLDTAKEVLPSRVRQAQFGDRKTASPS